MNKTPLSYGSIIEDPITNFTGNCENIIGFTPVPLGIAGPIKFNLNDKVIEAQLPLATTEACLVASVNRGFKAIRNSSQPIVVNLKEVGISRSLAFKIPENFDYHNFQEKINHDLDLLNELVSKQSRFAKVLKIETKLRTNFLYINIYFNTGQAMGMNMITIASKCLADQYFKPNFDLDLITVSANWCSDKKPSQHTKTHGRKFSLEAQSTIKAEEVKSVLKTSSQAIEVVDEVKLQEGSRIAGSLANNAHHANIVAASFIALGQDAAHTVDGSLGNSHFKSLDNGDLLAKVTIPALICGTIGGGTSLSVQNQTLELTGLQENDQGHYESTELAALIGCGVLAGELSLMSALSSQTLAESHEKLRRPIS